MLEFVLDPGTIRSCRGESQKHHTRSNNDNEYVQIAALSGAASTSGSEREVERHEESARERGQLVSPLANVSNNTTQIYLHTHEELKQK